MTLKLYPNSINLALQTLDNWGLNEAVKAELLGLDSVAELSELKITQDLTERCSLVNQIDKSLKICFNSKENIFGFVTMNNHNHPFNGSKPIDCARKSFDGLKMVDHEIAKMIIV